VIERWLQRIWYAETAPLGLRMLEAPYRAVIAVRRRRYAESSAAIVRFETPVVVVGNLSVGGTGKTPLVIALVRALAARGLRCGVVTRGYRSGVRGPTLVDAATVQPARHGDEPALIARATGVPVAICPDRVAAARTLIEQGVDVVVSDDGLQHYRLGRSLEIAVVDGARGLGNGRLLPAGPLREPPERLGEVDWLVVNGPASERCREQLAPFAVRRDQLEMRLVHGDAVRLGDPSVSRPLAQFAGKRVHAVAGIGHPARFFAMLRAAGLEPIEHPFPDHHAFAATDLAFGQPGEILMTAKDAVKCSAIPGLQAWEVPVEARFDAAGWDTLLAQIEAQARPAGAALRD
jgi:tetraacyldisaccharide 4'-kinase